MLLTASIASAESPTHLRVSIRVTCFVDWNSQLLLTGISSTEKPIEAAQTALRQVTKRIAQCLVKVSANKKFQVHLRFYHGWRKGYEPTPNFKAIRKAIAETDLSAASDNPNVTYASNVGYGDSLISALPQRLHAKQGIHLPNTLRDRGSSGFEEKMVDTALAADLVVCAYQDPDDWILLVAEDDDLIPPLFTAESIINLDRARVLLLSKRKRSNNLLLINGLDAS